MSKEILWWKKIFSVVVLPTSFESQVHKKMAPAIKIAFKSRLSDNITVL